MVPLERKKLCQRQENFSPPRERFAIDVANGFLAIIHNSFALLGLAVAFLAITLFARPDLRDAGESQLRSWLTARQMAELGAPVELAASDRATATNPKNLPKDQAAVAFWLSKKYRVAPSPSRHWSARPTTWARSTAWTRR